jgi:hypothetical protein
MVGLLALHYHGSSHGPDGLRYAKYYRIIMSFNGPDVSSIMLVANTRLPDLNETS